MRLAVFEKALVNALAKTRGFSPGTPVLPTGRVDRVVTYGYKNVTNF